jgi:hypothetical protein
MTVFAGMSLVLRYFAVPYMSDKNTWLPLNNPQKVMTA